MNATSNFILNDITIGNSKCTADCSYCCREGFKAGVGWDPLTGFGSVDYKNFLDFFATVPGSAVTAAPSPVPVAFPVWSVIIVVVFGGVALICIILAAYYFYCRKVSNPTESKSKPN